MAGERLNLAVELVGRPVREGRGGKVALREKARAWTYAELADRVARIGGALRGLGVKEGERVAVLMPDGLDAAAAILGAIHIGAVAVPISELGRSNDVRAMVRDAEAVVAFVDASLEPTLDEIRKEVASLREVIVVGGAREHEHAYEAIVPASVPVAAADTSADDVALLLYSAGPSDRAPRGVPHAHRTPLDAYLAYGMGVLGVTEKDRVFSAVKLSTAYGLGGGLVFPLAAGAESILLPEQPRTSTIFAILEKMKPTILFATPSILGDMLADTAKEASPASHFSSVRVCASGAETMPARLWSRCRDRLGLDVLQGYGLTEAFHFVISNQKGRTRPGASGVVIDGFEARLVAEEDGHALGPNEIGTLEVRGPTIANGYWNKPQESRATFREGGWLHTGDRFLVDSDGFWFHTGRTDDLFKVGGKWVSPAEVERTLLQHEAVWECAVVGVEDENGLTKPLAYVVTNVGHHGGIALERELIAFVKREIAPYKYPRWIEFVDALPKGPTGKVLRYKLPGKRPKRHRDPTVPSL